MNYKKYIAKKAFLLFTLLALTLCVRAQDSYVRPAGTKTKTKTEHITSVPDSSHHFYLGFGTGFNNYVGMIGLGMDFRVHNNFLMRVGVGIGTWGTKATIEVRDEMKKVNGKGWVLAIGFSHCSGIKNFTTQLAVDTGQVGGTITKQVTLNLEPANSLNFTASYNWLLHKRNIFYLEFGYAVALQSAPYQVLDGSVLDYSSKVTLDILSPGGLVLDCGFMFALK